MRKRVVALDLDLPFLSFSLLLMMSHSSQPLRFSPSFMMKRMKKMGVEAPKDIKYEIGIENGGKKAYECEAMGK